MRRRGPASRRRCSTCSAAAGRGPTSTSRPCPPGGRKKGGNGTGTEDYFNSGWYFDHGPVSQPLHGAVKKSDTEVSAYRFHLNDAVPFQRELRAAIEHGGASDTHDEDYATVAFWYEERPEPAA